jgi:hypothetical protein
MKKPNLLFIQSDKHCVDALRVNGHPLAKTPNLDQLAAAVKLVMLGTRKAVETFSLNVLTTEGLSLNLLVYECSHFKGYREGTRSV